MTRLHLQGQETLPGAPALLTALLSDPEALARCVPGVRRTEELGPQQAKLWVNVVWQGREAVIPLELQVTGHDPPALRLSGQGLGHRATLGFSVRLGNSDGPHTHCEWKAEGQVTGPATLLSRRAIQAGAEQLIRRTIRNLRSELEQRAGLLA
ncbi:CoxG family protein [Deinococcus radiophilus]|uniref:Carbon monoxide dehydrogenase n=1 Tax=Deinococcus radiophilus TaxID=32062 RepID=A0A3S0I9K2_9DEIO|nr:SRPBCC domain-containing protein [Deinococcus radiophilus]RTR27740.1 hypothetical protein EJ104_06020 [Deinococcus radiophilus]UFA50058.1 SRPBCC family protein [Deinococcus radiophilus]